MLEVIFKYVGQGDSIILKWNADNNTPRIGIIDCNKFGGTIPTVNYLEENFIKEIEFIVLSHPHYDHFSGLNDLLDYCDKKAISIKYFYHTKHHHPAYLKNACKSYTANTELDKLIRKVQALFDVNKIKKQSLDDFSSEIVLNSGLKMQCLSPGEREKEDFLSTKRYMFNIIEEDKDNNPKSNLLSTAFKIFTKDWYVLLTSDCVIPTFKRIAKEHNATQLLNGKLVLAQSPHHGSNANHYPAFWKHRKRDRGTYAAISVGENKYKHPSQETIDSFIENKYRVTYTCNIEELKEKHEYKEHKKIAVTLGVFSNPIVTGKDLCYSIDKNGIVTLNEG